MSDSLKLIVIGFIAILIFFCIKRQRRYWREMHTGRPTGSLKAGYKLAIATVFIALPVAALANSRTGWELFISVLLMTVVFCVKITFSPAVIGLVLGICSYQLYANDNFPFFEVWGSAASVIAWRLPEEFRVVYTTLTFLWAMAILLGGGSASANNSTSASASAAADLTDATSLIS